MQIPHTAADKMLVLLSEFKHLSIHITPSKRLDSSIIFPWEMTQLGIAEKLGVSRGYVTREINRLMDEGYIKSGIGRVLEMMRLVKVYSLTDNGEQEVERLIDVYNGGIVRLCTNNRGNGDFAEHKDAEAPGL